MGFAVAGGDLAIRDLEAAGSLISDMARWMRRRPAFRSVGTAIAGVLTVDSTGATGAEPGGDAARRRRDLVHEVTDILCQVPTPALLTFENLQWADELSLEILATLARRVPDLPLLAIGTYRSDELATRVGLREWRSRLLTQRLAEEANLARLSSAETGTMATLLLGGDLPAPTDVVAAIHDRSDGIPLHVEELVGSMRERPTWSGATVDAAGVPATIEDTVRGRLDLRSMAAIDLAESGAVIGRCFVIDVAAGILESEPEQLSSALRELIDHAFLVETSIPGLYDFRHALIRDAIYGAIPEPTRRRIHARVAELGDGLPGAGDAFRSEHLEQAGRRDEAFTAAVTAARAAVRWSAHREAAALYRRALRNLPADLAPADHAGLLQAYAVESAALDENQASAEAYTAARERWLAAGRPVEAAAVVAPLVSVRHLLGDDLETRVVALEGALSELDDLPTDTGTGSARLSLEAELAATFMLARHLGASLEHGRVAAEVAVAMGDEPSELHAIATIGSDLVFLGRMEEGWASLEAGIQRALASGHEAEAARGYRMLGSCASVLVEYTRAEEWLPAGISFAERTELWNHRHYMAAHLAHVRWATGQWPEAQDLATHALADGRGGLTTRITALHVLGYVALGRGDLARATSLLDDASQAAEPMHELQRVAPVLWGQAEVCLLAADPDGAIERCEAGLAASATVDDAAYLFPFLVTGTRAYLLAGDLAAAESWSTRVGERLRVRDIPGTRPALAHATGLIHLAAGGTTRAREALSEAATGWAERRRAWEGVGALIDLSEVHLRANRPADAIEVAERASATAAAMGARPLVERASLAIAAARARHPRTEPWEPLTSREFEVARLVAAGRTNPEIAEELGISTRTVGSHMEHILARLGVGRRAEVASWVTEKGVLHSRPHGRDREE
jgi:DNA-binding CsgD family transcriptional regulator